MDFLIPPVTAAGSLFVNGKDLLDATGAPFLIRGLNNAHGWYDPCGQYMAYRALDGIAATGANAVRIGWAFDSIDPLGPVTGAPEKPVLGTTPTLLAEILHRVVELEMVSIVSANDATGQITPDWPLQMAEQYAASGAPGYQEVLQAYTPFLIVEIANEWNGLDADYFTAYDNAIQHLRASGIDNLLMVSGNDWGQGCDAILSHAAQLLDADPDHNLIFDLHVFTNLTYGGVGGGTAEMVQGCLDDLAAADIPVLIGEFGPIHAGGDVAYQTLIERADAHGQGFTPWLWFGDTEYPTLNMHEGSWDGPINDWGLSVLPLGGVPATIFP